MDTSTEKIQETEQEQTTHHRLCEVQNKDFLPATIRRNKFRCRATNRKDAGSIPDGVIGIFH